MLTLLHISLALASVVYLAILLLSSKARSLTVAYASVVATLGSGVLLMVVRPETMAHVCVSGTIYLVVATAAISFAKYRYAKYFTA